MRVDVLHNGQIILSKELGDGSWKIGRSSDCAIRIKSPQISKQHALLVIKGDKVAVVDTGSSNGIFVNGILVRKQRLYPEDDIHIVDYQIKLVVSKDKSHTGVVGEADGNAALAEFPEEADPVAAQKLSPQEKLLLLIDQKILVPFYALMKTCDWRWMLVSILMIALVASVFLSIIPIVRWGKDVIAKEAIDRAHVILSQTVRENYRILSKTNDYTRLTVEACESERGILSCYILDPKTTGILAPTKLFNKTINDPTLAQSNAHSILAIKRIVQEKQELVHVQRDDNTYVIAQPIYLYSPDTNDKELSAIVLAVFEVSNTLASTFEPLVEAALFALLLSLAAYFFIYKMVSYPIVQMQEKLDAALKGENVSISTEAKFGELENLAQGINFVVSRLKQSGGGFSQPVTSNDTEAEDNAYIQTVQIFDQATSDAILLLNTEKKIKYVGKITEDMLSMRNQYAQGQNISDACRDPSFAGTAIDLTDRVLGALGEPQFATLEINGISRNLVAVAHKNSFGELRFVLVVVKMAGS